MSLQKRDARRAREKFSTDDGQSTQPRKQVKVSAGPGENETDQLMQQSARLFTQSEWINLEQQFRFIDPIHQKLIDKMGKGGCLRESDFDSYTAFSKQDLADKSWLIAPILVATNQERYNLTPIMCQRFARAHKKHVFWWPAN